jgi:Tfp pilus assembly protein PilP
MEERSVQGRVWNRRRRIHSYAIIAILTLTISWGPSLQVSVVRAQVSSGGAAAVGAVGNGTAQPPVGTPIPGATAGKEEYNYDPSGRRDPFTPLIKPKGSSKADTNLPPLQRVGLTELNLIGIIWGGFGYTAMVRTPDGKGYAVRRGTRVGPNNGSVTKITENSVIVTERFTDIYGKEQEREHIKLLHPSEESE